ncbi:Gfo/Idh/MocA family oxidoreductase [Actinoplanes subtropicus]|uniref:Gfo/Idh/MocA family oxidoreductase n=1 Tax=Actinoplanes subtropicus TaxID=543632 RepID=UPI0004C2F523|nr:Gfo/Idh/MocA family oxidoreductase [Actinoplanes subtropicus]
MTATTSAPTRVALIGAGRMGSFHAESLARRIPDAELAVIADPADGAAQRLAATVGCPRWTGDPAEAIVDPSIDAVVIVAPARTHAALVVAAAQAGKAVFCEKPMALTLDEADRAIVAAKDAGVALQVGFNRRFAADFRAAHQVVTAGGIGTPQLLRSVTRDPGLANPERVPPWTIYRETLIHDFDALLWLNPGARPVDVYAVADALVAPAYKASGLLDTSVVVIRFDNGAIATAEANFSAAYGYDVRGEVFGSAGMVTAGAHAQTSMRHYTASGIRQQTVRGDAALFHDAYTAEMAAFIGAARNDTTPEVTGHDARAALVLALAAIESVKAGRPVPISEVDA